MLGNLKEKLVVFNNKPVLRNLFFQNSVHTRPLKIVADNKLSHNQDGSLTTRKVGNTATLSFFHSLGA